MAPTLHYPIPTEAEIDALITQLAAERTPVLTHCVCFRRRQNGEYVFGWHHSQPMDEVRARLCRDEMSRMGHAAHVVRTSEADGAQVPVEVIS